MNQYIYCPVEGCEWWVADGGYTIRNLVQLKGHVAEHTELPAIKRRFNGGLVDEWLSSKVAEPKRDAVHAAAAERGSPLTGHGFPLPAPRLGEPSVDERDQSRQGI